MRSLGYGLAGVQDVNRQSDQLAQVSTCECVVGAAQDERVDLPWFAAELAHLAYVLVAECYRFRSVIDLNGARQAVAGLVDELGLSLEQCQQCGIFAA